jgi:hypothetical protein
VEVAIDLRALIAEGRFDPARDRVGLRGAAPPLSWQHTVQAQALAGRPGWYGLLLRLGLHGIQVQDRPPRRAA